MSNNKVIIIAGPTATGKTALALHLAQKITGELISADSRQIYKGLDIGTGKDTRGAKLQKSTLKTDYGLLSYYLFDSGVKLWLTDLITPNQSFSVARFLPLVKLLIQDIQSRHKIPILVGGTGLYIKALKEGILTKNLPPRSFLRRFLNMFPAPVLSFFLRLFNPNRYFKMTFSDQKNPRRLIRALELTLFKTPHLKDQKDNQQYLSIFLKSDLENLRFHIKNRIQKRLDQGLLLEIQKILEKYHWTDPGLNTLSYQEFKPYFLGLSDLKTCIQNWTFNEYHYAKRQLTWFKKQPSFLSFNSQDTRLFKKVFLAVSKMLQSN